MPERADLRTEKVILKLYSLAEKNKAGYTATPVACGWAGVITEVTRSFGQEQ